MKASDIRYLFYITHIDNVALIVQRGLLSHAEIERQQVPFTRIYDDSIVSGRRRSLRPKEGAYGSTRISIFSCAIR